MRWLTDPATFQAALVVEVLYGIAAALALLFISAPYGRHARGGWGPTIPARIAWVVMEAPAVFVFAAVLALGTPTPAALLITGFWMLHYIDRAFVYPLSVPPTAKPWPAVIVLAAIAFHLLNAYVNGLAVGLAAYPTTWLLDPRFVLGTALFFGGRHINRRSDRILADLRAPGETGYKVPHGFLYRYVSCPNYLGEIVEWTGWAVLTWSWAGAAFALYTACNLLPRAISHHRWYQATFPDYPDRKAVLPGLL